MRIVTRSEFLTLPAETLFSKYEPCVFGDLCIKGDTAWTNDFYYQQISDAIAWNDSAEFVDKLSAAQASGESLLMDFDCQMRDGLFDDDQLFAVWERRDVEALIARLEKSLFSTYQPQG